MPIEPQAANTFADYSVLDHLSRISIGTYKGRYERELSIFKNAAKEGRVVVWMSEISRVEMQHGVEKPTLPKDKRETALQNDTTKMARVKYHFCHLI